jgi:hypothetical protein
MADGHCVFHRKEEPLCDAHILPRSFFKRVLALPETDGIWLNEVGTDVVKRRPSGDYDQSILCASADAEIGKYDQYGTEFFLPEEPDVIAQLANGERWTKRVNLNYSKLSLFLLSYLWRAHHTKMPQYHHVNLGSQFEALARDALLVADGSVKKWFSFCVVWFAGLHGENLLPLKYPFRRKLDGVNYYIAYFLNFKVFMRLDSKIGPEYLEWLHPANKTVMTIPVLPYIGSNEYDNDRQSLLKYHRGAS